MKGAWLILGAALLYAPAAAAAPIAAGSELSLNGSDSFTASASAFSIHFFNPANVGGQSGSFAEIPNCTACAMMTDFTNTSSGFELYTATEGANSSTLVAASITAFQFQAGTLQSLAVQGTGTLTLTGFDATPGIWDLTTQGPGGPVEVTFSNTAVATGVPEPTSLALLGSALLGFWALVWKRRRFGVCSA